MKEMLYAAWRYRLFILSSIRNDFVVRFSRSKLGGLWVIIHPLMQVFIFALVLSEILAAKLPGIENKHAYALYLMAGMLGWSLFSDTVSRCLTLFIDNGNLMKKMAFPRICLPLITAGSVVVNNVLLFAAILVVFAILGHFPDTAVFWVPLLMILTLALGLGIGLILGVVNVFMRDVGQVTPVLLQILFWLTPIVYTLTTLPQDFRDWFSINPIYPLVASFQNALVFGQAPQWEHMSSLVIIAGATLVLALFMFRKAAAEMVDAL